MQRMAPICMSSHACTHLHVNDATVREVNIGVAFHAVQRLWLADYDVILEGGAFKVPWARWGRRGAEG